LLILIIPNICPYISAQLYRIPSVKETERRERENEVHAQKVASELMNESVKQFRSIYGKLFSEFESMEFGGIGGWFLFHRDVDPKYQKAARQRAAADPEFKDMMDAFRGEWEEATEEFGEIKDKSKTLWDNLNTKAAAQTMFAKNLACISPFANFVYVARDLTGTGLRSLDYFEQTKDIYKEQFRSYAGKKIDDAKEKNPALEDESLLDVSDRPRFVFKEEALKDKLNEILPYWGILVMFNVVFFAAAFAGFMIYDVR
jgi:hypothetical protein